jgi:hypothetical protein
MLKSPPGGVHFLDGGVACSLLAPATDGPRRHLDVSFLLPPDHGLPLGIFVALLVGMGPVAPMPLTEAVPLASFAMEQLTAALYPWPLCGPPAAAATAGAAAAPRAQAGPSMVVRHLDKSAERYVAELVVEGCGSSDPSGLSVKFEEVRRCKGSSAAAKAVAAV